MGIHDIMLMLFVMCQVAPSTEDKFTLSTMQDVSFDLSIFKSLTYLMVSHWSILVLLNEHYVCCIHAGT